MYILPKNGILIKQILFFGEDTMHLAGEFGNYDLETSNDE